MLLRSIEGASRRIQANCDIGMRDEKVSQEQAQQLITAILIPAQKTAKEIELESTFKRVWQGGGPFYLSLSSGITYQELVHELKVLRESIEADLEEKLFIFVPDKDAEPLYEMKEVWGPVWELLPDARGDVEESLSCHALDRHTASVFHSMRVAEYGLRHLARKLRIKITHTKKPMPVEFAAWDTVITAIKFKIEDVHKHVPKGPKRQALLERYSDAADHCLFMKEIWRNNVSHARHAYKKPEALGAIERVRDFMRFVALNFK